MRSRARPSKTSERRLAAGVTKPIQQRSRALGAEATTGEAAERILPCSLLRNQRDLQGEVEEEAVEMAANLEVR